MEILKTGGNFLREYHINLIFLIAVYGAYEDCWTTTIREDMIQLLNDTYHFFRIKPKKIPLTTPPPAQPTTASSATKSNPPSKKAASTTPWN